MIVVDASALVAIAVGEPDARDLLRVLSNNESVISQINYVEIGLILISRRRFLTQQDIDEWLASLRISLVAVDSLGPTALGAYLAYGRGFHPARLNLADCFAYALAKNLDLPLLFKGADLSQTDITPALQPT